MSDLVTNDVKKCRSCGVRLSAEDTQSHCMRCLISEQFLVSHLSNTAAVTNFCAGNSIDETGTDFGDYVLLNEIARGGMGRVYRALQKSLKRIVALKLPLPGVAADAERLHRFRTEAEAVATLSHPNIIPVFESGEWQGEPFFSMAYVEGETLSEILRRNVITPARAARYVSKIAEAIHHAHQRGVLHRDLKPGNIIVDASDEPRIADFGIARLLMGGEDGDRDLVAGTANYMAPEQIKPGNTPASVATDVYALGGILYYLLTGRPPFEGQSREQILWSAYYEELIPPAQLDPRVHRDLEAICLKALEKNPEQRYASAQAIAEDLERFEQGRPVFARLVSPMVRLWMWIRRNPFVSLLLTSLAAAVVIGAVAQMSALRKVRSARAASESFIGFMNQDLAHDLRDVGRLDLMEKINARAEDYYTNYTALGDAGYLERKALFFENAAAVEKDLGALARAEVRAAEAETIYEHQHLLEPSDPRWRRNQSRVRLLRLNIAKEAGLWSIANGHGDAALEYASAAVDFDPSDFTNRANLAKILLEQASFWIEQRRTEAPATNVARAEGILQDVTQKPKGDSEWSFWLANCAYYRGRILQLRGDYDAALSKFGEYLHATRELAARFPGNNRWQFELAVANSQVGGTLIELNQLDAAQSYFDDFRLLAKKLTELDPRNTSWLALYAKSLTWQGVAAQARHLPEPTALDYLSSALLIQSNLVHQNSDWDQWYENAAETTRQLIRLHENQSRRAQAVSFASEWRRQCEERALKNPTHVGHQLRWGRAIVAESTLIGRAEGRERQIAFLQESLAQFKAIPVTNPGALAKACVLVELAKTYDASGDARSAAAHLHVALELRLSFFDRSPFVAKVREQISDNFAWTVAYHVKSGDMVRAASLAEEGLNWASKHLFPEESRSDFARMCLLLIQAVKGPETSLMETTRRIVTRCLVERLADPPALSTQEQAYADRLREWLNQHP